MLLGNGNGGQPLPPVWPPRPPSVRPAAAGSAGHSSGPAVNPWTPNNPWASPWPAAALPSVDFVRLKLDGLEIGCYRFQGGTLPHELHVVIPRAEIERRSRAPDGSEQLRRTVLSSITIAHAPRYPSEGGAGAEWPAQPPAEPAQPSLPRELRRPYSATPTAPPHRQGAQA